MRIAALTILAALAVLPAVAVPAAAGTFTVEYCTQDQPNPPGNSPGWSSDVTGGAINPASAPAAWQNACTHLRAGSSYWTGTGAHFRDTTYAGGHALLRFVPPAGTTIFQVSAAAEQFISNGSCGIAGIWTTAGRRIGASGNPDEFLNDCIGEYSSAPFSASNAWLGADGHQGIEFGARCPATLPPVAGGYCGGAGIGLSSLVITLEDPSDASLEVTPTVGDDGRVHVAWAAADPQSGISAVRVEATTQRPSDDRVYPFGIPEFRSYTCGGPAAYPPCQTSISDEATLGDSVSWLRPGQSATVTVRATQGRGNGEHNGYAGMTTWTGTVTRPPTVTPTPLTPAPTLPPASPPGGTPPPVVTPTPKPPAAKVTLKTKVKKGRKLALSGTARGCTAVKVRTPGTKRAKSVKVKRGKWTTTVARKKGTYRVTCGSAAAKRTWR